MDTGRPDAAVDGVRATKHHHVCCVCKLQTQPTRTDNVPLSHTPHQAPQAGAFTTEAALAGEKAFPAETKAPDLVNSTDASAVPAARSPHALLTPIPEAPSPPPPELDFADAPAAQTAALVPAMSPAPEYVHGHGVYWGAGASTTESHRQPIPDLQCLSARSIQGLQSMPADQTLRVSIQPLSFSIDGLQDQTPRVSGSPPIRALELSITPHTKTGFTRLGTFDESSRGYGKSYEKYQILSASQSSAHLDAGSHNTLPAKRSGGTGGRSVFV